MPEDALTRVIDTCPSVGLNQIDISYGGAKGSLVAQEHMHNKLLCVCVLGGVGGGGSVPMTLNLETCKDALDKIIEIGVA